MTTNSKTITINFSNEEAAEAFATWLCEQGEQDYWMWMEEQERDSDNEELTATHFHYHKNKKFCPDGEINTTCGRQTPVEKFED